MTETFPFIGGGGDLNTRQRKNMLYHVSILKDNIMRFLCLN